MQFYLRGLSLLIVTADNSYPETWHCSSPLGVVSPSGLFLIEAKSQGQDL